MAFLSLLCSFMVFATCWLLLPMLAFGPLSVYFGWKSNRQAGARHPHLSRGRRLLALALAPMLIAIATMPAKIILVNATYRA